MTALVVGGTGPTGPHVIDGLLARGHEVTILHRGVHEPDDLVDVEHIHADPHFSETVEAALGTRTFDVVVVMYGRVKVLASIFAGRCRQLVATTGIVLYENALEPGRLRPRGMKVMAREAGPLAGERGPSHRFSTLVLDAERAVFDVAASGGYQATTIRYPAIYGARNPVPYEWSVIRRVRDGRPYMLVVDGGQEIVSRCAAENAAHAILCVADRPDVANGRAYNVADRDQYTTAQWIEIVTDILDAQLEIVSLPADIAMATYAELHPMPNQYSHLLVDTSAIRTDLGFVDVVAAEQAIAAYVHWLEAHPPQPGAYPGFIDEFDYAAEERLVAAYREAMEGLRANVVRAVPQRVSAHAMPHPKEPMLPAG
jgi:nucleoside-diphosphate-sugar epimerase